MGHIAGSKEALAPFCTTAQQLSGAQRECIQILNAQRHAIGSSELVGLSVLCFEMRTRHYVLRHHLVLYCLHSTCEDRHSLTT